MYAEGSPVAYWRNHCRNLSTKMCFLYIIEATSLSKIQHTCVLQKNVFMANLLPQQQNVK